MIPRTAGSSTSPPVAASSDSGMRRANAALMVVSALPVAVYVVTVVQRISYPYELQFFEGSTAEVSGRVVDGLPLYGPPTIDFTPWPYPPLYFLVTGELAKLTGLSLPTLRAVSFAASLVSFLLLALIVRRVTGSAAAGMVAAGVVRRHVSRHRCVVRHGSRGLAADRPAARRGVRRTAAQTWRGGLGVGCAVRSCRSSPSRTLWSWRRRSCSCCACGGVPSASLPRPPSSLWRSVRWSSATPSRTGGTRSTSSGSSSVTRAPCGGSPDSGSST